MSKNDRPPMTTVATPASNREGSAKRRCRPDPTDDRVAGLLKRWLAATHQCGVGAEHLQAYFDEFTFQLNHRHSRARGLLFLRLLDGAVNAPPTTMREPIKTPTHTP